MQRIATAVDLLDVGSLLFWLGVSLCAAVGHAVGGWLGDNPTSTAWLAGVISVPAAVLFASLAWMVARAMVGRWSRSAFCVAVVALAAMRGLTMGAQVSAGAPRSVHRGQPGSLTPLVVAESSSPGPRCRVDVADATDRRWSITVNPELCPLYRGEEIVVPTEAIVVEHRGDRPQPRVWVDGPGWVHRRHRGWAWDGAAVRLRHAAFDASRGRDGLAFVVASTLGVVRALPPQLRDRLRRSGLGHLIAISGLHVGLAAWLVLRTLGRALAGLRYGAQLAMVGTWIPVVFYVLATGSGAPAVRAATMLLVASLGALVGRPTHALTTLALAAALMLLWDPSSWASAGFQMSMVAMAVLVRTDPKAGLVAVSWRLGWAVLPIAWFHFGRLDGYGVAANVLAVPLFVGWIVPTALLGGLVAPWLGTAALAPASGGAELLLVIAGWVAAWPPAPPFVWISLAGAGLLSRGFTLRPTIVRWLPPRVACCGVLLVAAFRSVGAPPPPSEQWRVVPDRSSVSVVVFGEANVCILDPRGSASSWSRRAERWRRGRLEVVLSADLEAAPDVAAIVDALSVEPVAIAHSECAFPPIGVTEAAVARCRRAAGAPVEARWTVEDRLECRLPSGWIELAATLDDA